MEWYILSNDWYYICFLKLQHLVSWLQERKVNLVKDKCLRFVSWYFLVILKIINVSFSILKCGHNGMVSSTWKPLGCPVFSLPHCFPCASLLPRCSTEGPGMYVWVCVSVVEVVEWEYLICTSGSIRCWFAFAGLIMHCCFLLLLGAGACSLL